MPILRSSEASISSLTALGDWFMVNYAHKMLVGDLASDKKRGPVELEQTGL